MAKRKRRRGSAQKLDRSAVLGSLEPLKRVPLPGANDSWTVSDAARAHTAMAGWSKSVHARRSMAERVASRGDEASPKDLREFAKVLRGAATDVFSSTETPIWVDGSFSDMMRAAALSAEHATVNVEDLIAPAGVLYFSKAVPFPGDENQLVRALLWKHLDLLVTGGMTMPVVVAQSFGHGRPNDVYDYNGQPYREPYLKLHRWMFPVVGQSPVPEELPEQARELGRRNLPLIALLVSFAAIARSPLADQAGGSANDDAEDGDRRGFVSRSLRRSYLRRPEQGSYELDAARGGHGVRAHWVRGHWRKQWYASVQQHRFVWIAGYPKGDPKLGNVQGQKVLIAKGDSDLGKSPSDDN